jgi:hypothetical protein
MTPYAGGRHEELSGALTNLFNGLTEVNVDSICLVLQMNENENFKIYKEFDLPWKG